MNTKEKIAKAILIEVENINNGTTNDSLAIINVIIRDAIKLAHCVLAESKIEELEE